MEEEDFTEDLKEAVEDDEEPPLIAGASSSAVASSDYSQNILAQKSGLSAILPSGNNRNLLLPDDHRSTGEGCVGDDGTSGYSSSSSNSSRKLVVTTGDLVPQSHDDALFQPVQIGASCLRGMLVSTRGQDHLLSPLSPYATGHENVQLHLPAARDFSSTKDSLHSSPVFQEEGGAMVMIGGGVRGGFHEWKRRGRKPGRGGGGVTATARARTAVTIVPRDKSTDGIVPQPSSAPSVSAPRSVAASGGDTISRTPYSSSRWVSTSGKRRGGRKRAGGLSRPGRGGRRAACITRKSAVASTTADDSSSSSSSNATKRWGSSTTTGAADYFSDIHDQHLLPTSICLHKRGAASSLDGSPASRKNNYYYYCEEDDRASWFCYAEEGDIGLGGGGSAGEKSVGEDSTVASRDVCSDGYCWRAAIEASGQQPHGEDLMDSASPLSAISVFPRHDLLSSTKPFGDLPSTLGTPTTHSHTAKEYEVDAMPDDVDKSREQQGVSRKKSSKSVSPSPCRRMTMTLENFDKPAKPTSEGDGATKHYIHIGPKYQVPSLPDFFLARCDDERPYGRPEYPSSSAVLLYSPYLHAQTVRLREQQGLSHRVVKNEQEKMDSYLHSVAQNWKQLTGWQPFSPEYAYKLLHTAHYDPYKALWLLNHPNLDFENMFNPPTRKYENKWRPQDRRGIIPMCPFPPIPPTRSNILRRKVNTGYLLR